MSGSERDAARRLVTLLERLLEERSELLDRVGRLPAGEAQTIQQALHQRLETLTREQARIIAELAALLPPEEPRPGGSPN